MMDPHNRNAGAASWPRDYKRRKYALEGVGAAGSGDGSALSSSETEANFHFHGVSSSASTVEIKKYSGSHSFYLTVQVSRVEAAVVHDLARLYKNSDYPDKNLNIRDVVHFLLERDPALALATPQDLGIGKEFYLNFVREQPLTCVHEQWETADLKALQIEILAKASVCFRTLKEAITRKCCVRGPQRSDLDEILPSLSEDDSYDLQQCLDLRKEIQDLNVKAAKDASTITRLQELLQQVPCQKEIQLRKEIQDLKVKAAKDASTITRLQELLQQAPVQSQPEVLPQDDLFSEEDFLTEDGRLACIQPNEEQLYSAPVKSQPEVLPQDDLFSEEDFLTEDGRLACIQPNEEQLYSAPVKSQPEVLPQDDLFSEEELWVKGGWLACIQPNEG